MGLRGLGPLNWAGKKIVLSLITHNIRYWTTQQFAESCRTLICIPCICLVFLLTMSINCKLLHWYSILLLLFRHLLEQRARESLKQQLAQVRAGFLSLEMFWLWKELFCTTSVPCFPFSPSPCFLLLFLHPAPVFSPLQVFNRHKFHSWCMMHNFCVVLTKPQIVRA